MNYTLLLTTEVATKRHSCKLCVTSSYVHWSMHTEDQFVIKHIHT